MLYDSYPPKTLESEVEQRFKKLKAEYRLSDKTARDVSKDGLAVYAAPAVAAGSAVAVIIGMAVWKWYNSS